MPTVEASPCPACAAPPGSVSLAWALAAAAVGEFSLAGVMPKFPAREVPVLDCSSCGLRLVGRVEGRHVVFDPPTQAK